MGAALAPRRGRALEDPRPPDLLQQPPDAAAVRALCAAVAVAAVRPTRNSGRGFVP
jgi:hypothetical protein